MEKHRHNLISLLLVAVVLIGSWVASDRGRPVLTDDKRSRRQESALRPAASELTTNYQQSTTTNHQPPTNNQLPVPTNNQQLATDNKSLVASRQSLTTASVFDSIQPATLPPSVSAISALVKDLSTGAELFTASPRKQWSLASLVKLMTAVVAVENLPEDQLLTVSRNAVATEGAAGFLVAGKKYSLAELLRSMLAFSSNDAAVAIAENYSKDQFIIKMNSKAGELGMKDSRFFDPSGLSALNQSTVEDLALLMNYIYQNRPQILAITREIIEGATHPFNGQPDFMGGKTGFIDEAGGNLISLFNYQGRPILIIILGSDQRAEDTQILRDWFLN